MSCFRAIGLHASSEGNILLLKLEDTRGYTTADISQFSNLASNKENPAY